MTTLTTFRSWAALVAVGVTACSLSLHAGPPTSAPAPMDAGKIKEVVQAAAKLCRWVDWPSRKMLPRRPSEDPYLQAIRPVTEMGKAALPVLREMAGDEKLTPYERRVAELLASRIQNPQPFAEMDRRLHNPIPVRPGVHPPERFGRPYIHYIPEFPSVHMLHPKHQKIIKRYPQAWKQMQAAYRHTITAKPDSKRRITTEDCARLDKIRAKIQSEHSIPNKDFPLLMYIKGVSPKYLLAWEEAAIRPLPRKWKMRFIMDLTETADIASAPVLGELCRQALGFVSMSFKERRSVVEQIARAFGTMPSRATLLEVSEILQVEQKLDRNSLRDFGPSVGISLAKSEKWNVLLAKLASEKEMAGHVQRVRAVMEPYVKYLKQKAASATTRPASRLAQGQ